jgi:DNA-binding Lrp family transcriptional regulator
MQIDPHPRKVHTTAKPPTSWRDVLRVHPAAELFPRMNEDEIAALAADIKKNGLTSPIILWSPGHSGDGMKERPQFVLDGINRLDALERAGIPFLNDKAPTDTYGARFQRLYEKKRVYSLLIGGRRGGGMSSSIKPDTDPYVYVISANIRRRHLTIEQKDELITKLLKADPTKSNRQIAKMVDASHPHVAQVRKRAERAGDVETVTTSVDTKGRKQPATKPGARKKATDPLPQVSEEVLQKREEAAERIRALIGKATDDDASPGSTGEIARLRDDIDAEPPLLGILFKAWDRAPEPVRQKFMARVGLIPDPLAIPPPLRRAP